MDDFKALVRANSDAYVEYLKAHDRFEEQPVDDNFTALVAAWERWTPAYRAVAATWSDKA